MDSRLNDADRSGVSRRSKLNRERRKGGMRGMSISQALKKKVFRFVLYTITVSDSFDNIRYLHN